MKALFELFRRFDARRIFGFIRRLGGMSRPKVKCYDLRSTRALRMEGDSLQNAGRSRPNHNFYPRPPGGGRHKYLYLLGVFKKFLSTPSGWRATKKSKMIRVCGFYFYPRPPGGGRPLICGHACPVSYFYPRPPGGGRRRAAQPARRGRGISIHALRVEGDIKIAF